MGRRRSMIITTGELSTHQRGWIVSGQELFAIPVLVLWVGLEKGK
jgi:hypothetical protein